MDQIKDIRAIIDFRHCIMSPYIGFMSNTSKGFGEILLSMHEGELFDRIKGGDNFDIKDYGLFSKYFNMITSYLRFSNKLVIIYEDEIEKELIEKHFDKKLFEILRYKHRDEVKIEDYYDYNYIVTYREDIVDELDIKDDINIHLLDSKASKEIVSRKLLDNISLVRPYDYYIKG